MAQVTETVARGILAGQGYTDNEVRQLAHRWLASHEQAPAQAAPAAVAEPVAYRVLRKRHDGEWVTDGRAWCDGVPTQDLVDDIALRSDGWRIEYAFAAPTAQAAPVAQGGVLPSLFREALAWGMTYGPEIPAHQWEEMRESMVEKFTARAQAKEGEIHE